MRIERVEARAISIPLPEPVSDAVRFITHRDHLLVTIHAGDVSGTGFVLGYDAAPAMVRIVNDMLQPLLLGKPAFETEEHWTEMYRQTIQAGRRGAVLRAISAVDIALWDLRGKAAGMPVWALLGGSPKPQRCYVTGGYYRAGQTIADLLRETDRYMELGFSAFKLKVGKLTAAEDVQRMAAVRRHAGDEVEILLDANGGWASAPEAIAAMRRLEEYRPHWIEEPVRADNLHAMKAIADALLTPVATGELEATRWAFAQLIGQRAADVIQPDATVCGGVSEWLKIAHMASGFDVPVAPHYHWDVHTQLAAAIPNLMWIEYFDAGSGVKMFDRVLRNPMHAEKGWIAPRAVPGFGWELDEQELGRYAVA